MTRENCAITVNGETLELDVSGALWWPAEKTLVLADIHFEKGSAYARTGQFLPPYDTRVTLARLEKLVSQYMPARLIALGDSFHDDEAGDRLDAEERTRLTALTLRTDFIWVEGNHDPHPPSWLGGRVESEVALGPLFFRHIPLELTAPGEVAGHVHPVVRISRGGVSVRRRCFVSDRRRLLMPAFGAYTGGYDVREAAVTSLFGDHFAVHALGRDKVYSVAAQPLRLKKSVASQPRAAAKRTVRTP